MLKKQVELPSNVEVHCEQIKVKRLLYCVQH